jgi:hypothetical protein
VFCEICVMLPCMLPWWLSRLGAVSQFEKANLVAKLRAARERKIAAGGRGSERFTYAQKVPEVVALVRELYG